MTIKTTTSSGAKRDKSPLIFVSAGDPSGDMHVARLIEALKKRMPDARFIGYAGPQTTSTCCDVRFDLTKLSVMMLSRVFSRLPQYMRLLNQTDAIFRDERPDMVVVVDFPGFNWKIAQKAKKFGIPVVYFMPPQIWGWGQWRVKKMRRYVDLVLSCFSFEDKWFRERGCRSEFVSHPFFEEIRKRELDVEFLESLAPDDSRWRYLTLLPGSRDQEVAKNARALLEAARKVCDVAPDVQPVVAAFRESHAEFVHKELADLGLEYPVFVGKTPELMKAATCCLAVSGSVSIELLSFCKPSVVVYRIDRLENFVLRFLKRVKYITLTNILAIDRIEGETPFYPKGYLPKSTAHTPRERELMVFPEYISPDDVSDQAASDLLDLLNSPEKLAKRVAELEALRGAVDCVESPIEEAASKIQAELERLRA